MEHKTIEELTEFIRDLVEKKHDYNTSAEAMSDAAVAAFNFVAYELRTTGFQAEWAALRAYGEIQSMKCPFGIVSAKNMLYPQHDEVGKVRKWQEEWSDWLAEEAQKNLDGDMTFVAPTVRDHWKHLAAAQASKAEEK